MNSHSFANVYLLQAADAFTQRFYYHAVGPSVVNPDRNDGVEIHASSSPIEVDDISLEEVEDVVTGSKKGGRAEKRGQKKGKGPPRRAAMACTFCRERKLKRQLQAGQITRRYFEDHKAPKIVSKFPIKRRKSRIPPKPNNAASAVVPIANPQVYYPPIKPGSSVFLRPELPLPGFAPASSPPSSDVCLYDLGCFAPGMAVLAKEAVNASLVEVQPEQPLYQHRSSEGTHEVDDESHMAPVPYQDRLPTSLSESDTSPSHDGRADKFFCSNDLLPRSQSDPSFSSFVGEWTPGPVEMKQRSNSVPQITTTEWEALGRDFAAKFMHQDCMVLPAPVTSVTTIPAGVATGDGVGVGGVDGTSGQIAPMLTANLFDRQEEAPSLFIQNYVPVIPPLTSFGTPAVSSSLYTGGAALVPRQDCWPATNVVHGIHSHS
ncbi:hypothetical protein BT69DRAFT_1353362 [Atractiella rhizophila]|nr:hypothetical protein BT69DRAFT_1353362 [Atractiella rhizophila]